MRLSIGAILMVTVPEMIIRSECRGDAHGTIPRRSTSNREANVAIISIAQQARPKVTGQIDDLRAQLRNASTGVVTTKTAGKAMDPVGDRLESHRVLVADSGRTWCSACHSCRSLKSFQTGAGIWGTGDFTCHSRIPSR